MGEDSLGLMVSCETVLRLFMQGRDCILIGRGVSPFLGRCPTVWTSPCLFGGWGFGLAL